MKLKLTSAHHPENSIGARLRRWREGSLRKQTTLARKLGVTPNILDNWERNRTPLPWGVFLQLWELYDLSPYWLGGRQGPVDHPFPLLRTLIPQAPAGAYFADVYAEKLAPQFEADAQREERSCVAALERMAKEAKAGKLKGPALRAIVQVAHENYEFPKTIFVASGPAGARQANS
jgi:transcriptional regulator with XRE-family HTH domain